LRKGGCPRQDDIDELVVVEEAVAIGVEQRKEHGDLLLRQIEAAP
jgi:hypothetical protein